MRARSETWILIENLDERHPGLTATRARALYEAASVCLDRHHASPALLRIDDEGTIGGRQIAWVEPNGRAKVANGNEIDATCDGAYAVSLATIEVERGLVAIGRAWTGSGADFFLTPKEMCSTADFETALRLEVSGVDKGGASTLRHRLKQKRMQLTRGKSDSAAIASVVGFRELLVLLGTVT